MEQGGELLLLVATHTNMELMNDQESGQGAGLNLLDGQKDGALESSDVSAYVFR